MSYDPLKKSEYQFRLVASVVIYAMLIYVTTTHGLRGPALFEVGLFGGAFATLTLPFHLGVVENSNAGTRLVHQFALAVVKNYILNAVT